MNNSVIGTLSKVPAVTAGFWIIKLVATTLGEIGGNALSMSLNLGYEVSTAILSTVFIFSVYLQIERRRFQPAIYWFAIVASTTVGTTTADLVTRDIGLGYAGGSLLLLAAVTTTLTVWRYRLGTISVASVSNSASEVYYWLTITFSQTLGTALGDWFADSAGFGYLGSTLIFTVLLIGLYVLYRITDISRTAIFWAAFIITRPFGAVVGNLIDTPPASGGFEISRFAASGVLLALIAVLIVVLPQQPATKNGAASH
ncbi:MAG: hypothetical protein C4324_12150 [Blastocatellia bacterium]